MGSSTVREASGNGMLEIDAALAANMGEELLHGLQDFAMRSAQRIRMIMLPMIREDRHPTTKKQAYGGFDESDQMTRGGRPGGLVWE